MQDLTSMFPSLEKSEQIEGQGVEVTANEHERADGQSEPRGGNEKETPTDAELVTRPVVPACRQCGDVMVLRKAR